MKGRYNMSVVEIILGAVLLIASIVLVVVIILQEGNQQGVGVVSGGADTFFSKNKARSYDAFLARATKWFAIGFVVVVLLLPEVLVEFLAGAQSTVAALGGRGRVDGHHAEDILKLR